jgi:hypothetical protein
LGGEPESVPVLPPPFPLPFPALALTGSNHACPTTALDKSSVAVLAARCCRIVAEGSPEPGF